MRYSRRASSAAAAAAVRAPVAQSGPFCSHCERSVAHDPAHIRCAANECFDLLICVYCFSVGAADEEPHKVDHPYRVIERVADPLYVQNWSADEELRLLHALLDNGPHHWKSVAEYVKSKSARKCETHYYDVYLNAPTAPLPDDTALERGDDAPMDAASPAPSSAAKASAGQSGKSGKSGRRPGKRSRMRKGGKSEEVSIVDPPSPENDDEGEEDRTVPSAAAGHSGALEGFMPLRGDFDVEWDDQAEELIADLAVHADDNEEELDLKARLCEMYDKRLKRREAVKEFLFDRDMLNFDALKFSDRRGARDEKELAARLQVFSRIMPKEKFDAFYTSIMTEHQIAKQTNQVARSREAGMRALSEVEIYEIERKVRVAALQERAKTDVRDGVRRRSSAGMALPALHGKRENFTPSPSPESNAPVSMGGPGNELLYVPPPGVATPESLGEVHLTGDDGTGMSNAVGEQERDGTPTESRSTMQRRAREQKRIMRSPYPQLSAMSIRDMEDESKLTFTEKKFCSALNIAPREFLRHRDAMLHEACQGGTGAPQDPDPNSTTQSVLTLRSTRPPILKSIESSENDVCVDVVQRPITRSAIAGKRWGKRHREIISHESHIASSLSELPQSFDAGDISASPAVRGKRVKLERVPSPSHVIKDKNDEKQLDSEEPKQALAEKVVSALEKDQSSLEKTPLESQENQADTTKDPPGPEQESAAVRGETAAADNTEIKERKSYDAEGAKEQSSVGVEVSTAENNRNDSSGAQTLAKTQGLADNSNDKQSSEQIPHVSTQAHQTASSAENAQPVVEPAANKATEVAGIPKSNVQGESSGKPVNPVDNNSVSVQVDNELDDVMEVTYVDSKDASESGENKAALKRESSVEIVHVHSAIKADLIEHVPAAVKPRRGRKKGSKNSKPPNAPVRRSRRNQAKTNEEVVEVLEDHLSPSDDKGSSVVVVEEILDEGDGGSLAAELAGERSEGEFDLFIPRRPEDSKSPNNRMCETEIPSEPDSPDVGDSDRDTEDYVPSPENDERNGHRPRSRGKSRVTPVRKSARIMRRKGGAETEETSGTERTANLRSRRALEIPESPEWQDDSSGSNAITPGPSRASGRRKRTRAEFENGGQQGSSTYQLRRRR